MHKKIKLLYTTCYLDVSGVTKLNFDILNFLKADFDIHILTTNRDDFLIVSLDGPFASAFRKPVKLYTIGKDARFSFFVKHLEDNEIDIIFNTHSLWIYEHIAKIKKLFPRIRIVDSLHVLEPYFLRGGFPDISANKYIHKFIDLSILISDDLKKYLIENYSVRSEKLVIIRNGIDARYYKNDKLKNLFKAELNLRAEDKLIGYIGRLSMQKRPEIFVEIAKKLVGGRDDLFFYMIGSGPLEKKILKDISQSGLQNRFFLFQKRSDLDKVYNSTDLLIAPSAYEGAPLVILEALASEVPVIASDVGAINEYVPQMCHLIKIDFMEKRNIVRQAIKVINEKENISYKAKFVRDNYSIDKVGSRYKEALLKCIRNSGDDGKCE